MRNEFLALILCSCGNVDMSDKCDEAKKELRSCRDEVERLDLKLEWHNADSSEEVVE